MSSSQRTALIVGAGTGLGRAIALAFAAAGTRVAVADLNLEAAQETLALAKAPDGLALRLDIAQPADCATAVQATADKFGRLDILVNCAAICFVDPLIDLTPERFDKVFAVNSRGAFFIMQAAAKIMIQQNSAASLRSLRPPLMSACRSSPPTAQARPPSTASANPPRSRGLRTASPSTPSPPAA